MKTKAPKFGGGAIKELGFTINKKLKRNPEFAAGEQEYKPVTPKKVAAGLVAPKEKI